jgi:CheY-specific phosphatase CheX
MCSLPTPSLGAKPTEPASSPSPGSPMPARFFGRFLLDAKVITAEQLTAAVAHQERANRPFGETAVALDLLSEEQVGEVLELQSYENLKSGEAAVRLGLLSEAEVGEVLAQQEREHVKIGEALVATGALTSDDLERWLAAFVRSQVEEPATGDAPQVADPIGIAAPLIRIARVLLHRVARVPSKFGFCQGSLPGDVEDTAFCGALEMNGEVRGRISVRASLELAWAIAQRVLGEPVVFSDLESIGDAALEFVNLVAGRLGESLSAEGRHFDFGYPALDVPEERGLQHGLCVRLLTPHGTIDFSVWTTAGATVGSPSAP